MWFAYDGDSLVFSNSSGDNPWNQTFYVWGPTGPIQQIFFSNGGYFGAQTLMFDPNGNTVSQMTGGPIDAPVLHIYDAYGQPVWPLNSDPGNVGVPNHSQGLILRYKGQAGYVTDTNIDLIYCWHRY